MPYFVENDDLRREVQVNTSRTLYFFPKYGGENILTSGTPTYSIRDPSGTELYTGTCTVTVVGEVHRLDVTVPAIATLDEDYSIHYTYTALVLGTPQVRDTVFFDVVAYPLDSSVSLNDLLEERPDVAEVLDRMGVRLGFTAGNGLGESQRAMAGIFSRRALVELDALIRSQILKDRDEEFKDYNSFQSARKYRSTRPNLILNRERLNRPLRKLAMMLVYAADMAEPESEDESAGLYRYYQAESDAAWRSIGPLKYDFSEDLVPDMDLGDIGRSVQLRRVQG